jgi:hypothetical protein
MDNCFVSNMGLTIPPPQFTFLYVSFSYYLSPPPLLVSDVSTTGCKVTIVHNIGMITMPVEFTEPFTRVNPVPSTTTTWQQCELATLE